MTGEECPELHARGEAQIADLVLEFHTEVASQGYSLEDLLSCLKRCAWGWRDDSGIRAQAILEDPDSVPRAYMVAHHHL